MTIRDALVWDQHGCLPLRPDPDAIDSLDLYRRAGVDAVSINVGFDLTSPAETLKVLAAFRSGVLARPDHFRLVSSAADVLEAKQAGQLAVSFDLEGTEPLDGDLQALETLWGLGVRAVSLAYNRRNRAAGGCHDDPEIGLTAYGRALVSEMNRLGVIVDAAHCSRRTTFDLFEQSSDPVIFSHAVPAGVWAHDRNLSDDQMRACAQTGGVIGINGVGIFLGRNDASTEAIVRAIVYAVDVVGPEHVGIGLDYVFDREELNAYLNENAQTFPATGSYTAFGPMEFVSPAQLHEVTEKLSQHGYGDADIEAILGLNFLRVASQVWSA